MNKEVKIIYREPIGITYINPFDNLTHKYFPDFYIIYEDGRVYSTKTSKFLKPEVTRDGYYQITLCTNGIPERLRVHQLVARLFISNKDNLPQINHKDGNKLNNSVDNLEWCTAYSNNKHARDTGLNNISKSNAARWEDPLFRERVSRNISNGCIGKKLGNQNARKRTLQQI
jgi:hypothetical protein